MDKEQVKERQQQIIALVKGFCDDKLNEECFELCERLIQKLGRKRTVPFMTGKVEIWAAGVVHAIGTINFLFDSSFKPYTTITEINTFFGTAKSSSGNKSKEIRDLLKLTHWDNEFSTQRMKESNPFANLVSINGFIVNINSLQKK